MLDKRLKKPFFLKSAIFVALSALLWSWSNDFNLANENGFDPLRYNFYAISKPQISSQLGQNYNIVNILALIYTINSSYLFFILTVTFLHFSLCRISNDNLKFCMWSPVAFLYVAQTGKDFICYSLVIAFLTCISSKLNLKKITLFAVLLALVLYIRPSFLVLLPIFFMSIKISFKMVVFIILALCFVYSGLFGVENNPQMEVIAGVVENSSFVSELRLLSFESGYFGYLIRFLMYSSAPIFQLPVNILKLLSSDNLQNYVFFETLTLVFFIIFTFKSGSFKDLMKYSVIFSIPLAFFTPFYHFRYIFLLWPFFLAIPKLIDLKVHK